MKRKLLFVLLSTIVVLAVTPLTAAAASLSSDVVALISQDVKSTSSDGVKRNLDNDFAISPIGKSKSPSKMHTAPPPASSIQSQGISTMSSNNLYLIDAYAYLGINTSNKLSVLGNTAANQKVDSIYGGLTLERWNGSAWESYITYSLESISNKSSLSVAKSGITAATGYYYQTYYVTFLTHGNKTEGTNKISGALWHSN